AAISEAQDLALVLRAGSLPAPLQIVDERNVGATLGADSIRQGRTAAIVASVMVVLTMLLYYRGAGLLAVVALLFYVLFTLGGLAWFGATLTLPGLAGFVLSLGIAVDANVLIFERIREELKLGKTARVAVEAGFASAMPAIIDANVTTVTTAAFLFWFGTGPVKGFAVTLIVGILASLVTAVFVTKTLFLIWLQRRDPAKELPI
ncbi:MAG: protein translocase subunit SecD, partial [Gemmatimonadales bacterium]